MSNICRWKNPFALVFLLACFLVCAAAMGGAAANRGAAALMSAPAKLVVEIPSQPEVNDPPKFESITVDFPVKEGNLPGIDTDQPRGCVRVAVMISFLVSDPDNDKVTVMVDLDGDGKFNDFKKKTKADKAVVWKKKFTEVGEVWIKYKACDVKGLCTATLKFKLEMITCPPKIVEFATKTERVGSGDRVFMTLRSSDPQDDMVRYEADWDDDGAYEEVTPYGKPSKRITLKHTFSTSTSHVISARVCDALDGCSEVERRTVVVKSLEE
ncbi:MAG: hypothetical protein ABIJ56_10475 [Pseudomonadota bacterium]